MTNPKNKSQQADAVQSGGASVEKLTSSPAENADAGAAPPTETKRLSKLARSLLSVVLIGALSTTIYLAFWRANLKRFSIVREGVLIRSGQPTEFGLKHLVRHHGVKTILSLRQEDDLIHIGALDGGEPSGRRESDVVAELEASYLHWPMGGEAYWPWLPPKQFEEFYELFDNPENVPVAVHCVAGRHRTGTLAALYRLEYDRWSVSRVMDEVYSYDFGPPIPIQNVLLRNYTPRPQPAAQDWPEIRARFANLAPQAKTYESLIAGLRNHQDQAAVVDALATQIEARAPFSMAIARRMIPKLTSDAQTRLAELAGAYISQIKDSSQAEIASAAAMVADFGCVADQQLLIELLQTKGEELAANNATYEGLVDGICDRYTPNRLPYLEVLLSNVHKLPSPDAAGFRYCDLAVAQLTAIVNERFVDESLPDDEEWDAAVAKAFRWYADNNQAQQLTRRIPPIEHRMAMDATRLEQDGGERFR